MSTLTGMTTETADGRAIAATLHVDTDSPNVIDRGDGVYWIVPDPVDAEPTPQALGPEWREVGYVVEAPA